MGNQIEVPLSELSSDAVAGLVDEFITREGTDYGLHEYSLEQKRATVMKQLEHKQIAIIFDFESESTTLVTRQQLKEGGEEREP